MRPTREKSYLRASKNMPSNNCVAVSTSGRIARPQFAVDFDQSVFAGLDRVLFQRGRNHRADFVALGEEDFETVDAGFDELADDGGRQFLIGVDHDFAGRHIDHVGGDESAFQIVGGHFDLRDLVLDDLLHQAGGDLAALRHDTVSPALLLMACESFRPIRLSSTCPVQLRSLMLILLTR